MNDYGKPLREILKKSGCWLVRQGKGDHEYWCGPQAKQPFAVDGRIKSRHTANAILKQAGLPDRFR